MLQGPFRVPSFNGYIPRRLQPWIYLLFAFIFLMSGGIYGGAMSQVMGEYSLMREDVLRSSEISATTGCFNSTFAMIGLPPYLFWY